MLLSQRLPPLNALRAFEAAGRHLSFTRAANELNVTQAAISHQIKSLEDHLGLPLFRRLNRALLLTEEGQYYLPSVSRALDDLRKATEQLLQRDASGVLTVTVLPSFAARWLVPRLGRFLQAHPDIEVRIAPTLDLADFAQGDVDIAIRYGYGSYPGLYSERFMSEDIYPVCSPDLLQGLKPLTQPEDLQHHHLLHDDGIVEWRLWLLAAGIDDIDLNRGTFFTDSSMLIQAAIAGHGVALGRSVLVEDDIAAGRLVRPFALSLPTEYAYYIVYPEASAERPKIVAFREWMLQERDR